MGVFENMPSSGSGVSAKDLSAMLNVDERLLSELRDLRKVKQHCNCS